VKRPSRTSFKAVLCAVAVLVTASSAHAIDKCKVKVDKRTGVILASATGVGGPLTWGEASGQEVNNFFNSGTCVVGDKAKGCQLGDPNTLASKTAPAGCTLYLDDGATPCSAWIPGCSPGVRSAVTTVMKDANGAVIGTVLDPIALSAIRDTGSELVRLPVLYGGSGFENFGYIYYLSTDCTGAALMQTDPAMIRPGTVFGTTAYVPPLTGTSQTYNSQLQILSGTTSQALCDLYYGAGVTTFVAPTGCCRTTSFMVDLGTPGTIDLSAFVAPFTVEQ
jgi:hypothetical protein